tara:strand:- start:5095 stop:5337 length:243 start_codon:yes stop_codon:yes gene_type:complete
MAYTRKTNTDGNWSYRGIIFLSSDNKYNWELHEKYETDQITGSPLGSGVTVKGKIELAAGQTLTFDGATAALKAKWDEFK